MFNKLLYTIFILFILLYFDNKIKAENIYSDNVDILAHSGWNQHKNIVIPVNSDLTKPIHHYYNARSFIAPGTPYIIHHPAIAGLGVAQHGKQQAECDKINNKAAIAVMLHGDTTAITCDGLFNWYGTDYSVPGEYQHTLKSQVTNLDSIVTLHLLHEDFTITARPDTTIQNGDSAYLWAKGADFYKWTPTDDISKSEDSYLYAHPNHTTTYNVTGYKITSNDQNVVYNGNFDLGNIGFSTTLNYFTPYTTIGGFGTYTISDDVKGFWQNLIASYKAYGGNGNMMIVDGQNSPNSIIWKQLVSVKPNTYYAFSVQVMSCWASHEREQYALLQFSINGELIGPIFHSPNELYKWKKYYEIWYSGNATTAQICILNQNTNGYGNDFALDEIRLDALDYVCLSKADVTIHVSDKYDTDSIENVTICEGNSHLWHGRIFTTSTIQTEVLLNSVGGDSICTLNLNVIPIQHGDTTATSCDNSFTWYGTPYTNDGNYQHILQSKVTGCDSIVTLHLSFLKPTYKTDNISICEGESYTWHGRRYTNDIIVSETLTNSVGCDSICTLNLKVKKQTSTVTYDTICSTETFSFNNQQITHSGIYVAESLNEENCKHTDTLYLTMIEPTRIALSTLTMCADDEPFEISYTYTGEKPVKYSILFDDRAKEQGFYNIYEFPATSNIITLPINRGKDYPRPNDYTATLIFFNNYCQDGTRIENYTFTLQYPSWVTKQRWNDVIGVLNSKYNGGYTFSEFQWYCNGNLLIGETKDYLYLPHYLEEGAEYNVALTRADDNKTFFTCPITPVYMKDSVVITEPYISVVPTIVVKEHPVVNILSNVSGTYKVYSTSSSLVTSGTFAHDEHFAYEITLPNSSGIYLFEMVSDDGKKRITKVVVQ